MGPDHELLEHAHTNPVAGGHATQLLHVDVAQVERVDLVELPAVGALCGLVVPTAVTPRRVEVPEPLHLEVEDRLELHRGRRAVAVAAREARPARSSRAG